MFTLLFFEVRPRLCEKSHFYTQLSDSHFENSSTWIIDGWSTQPQAALAGYEIHDSLFMNTGIIGQRLVSFDFAALIRKEVLWNSGHASVWVKNSEFVNSAYLWLEAIVSTIPRKKAIPHVVF